MAEPLEPSLVFERRCLLMLMATICLCMLLLAAGAAWHLAVAEGGINFPLLKRGP